jgi:hypothetical protein
LSIVVGRNSHFHDLTKEEHDELGGVEYRSLRVLFWIVLLVSSSQPARNLADPLQYYICFQLFAFIIAGPYIAAKNYQDVFRAQFRYVPEYWFSAFQVVSAFSNTGMSLCDQSMVPFQNAYVLIAGRSGSRAGFQELMNHSRNSRFRLDLCGKHCLPDFVSRHDILKDCFLTDLLEQLAGHHVSPQSYFAYVSDAYLAAGQYIGLRPTGLGFARRCSFFWIIQEGEWTASVRVFAG